jgi:two-component system, chemotaxis family, response regulator Rcp1
MAEQRLRSVDILLVEDNPGDVRLIQEILRGLAIPTTLHAVASGEAALAFLRHQGEYGRAPRPDIILLDLHLPGRDGFQVFAELRQDPALRDIPVAVYIGQADWEKEQLAAIGPVRAYLRKSVTLDHSQYAEVLEGIRREQGGASSQ